jgi:hypothetical protein
LLVGSDREAKIIVSSDLVGQEARKATTWQLPRLILVGWGVGMVFLQELPIFLFGEAPASTTSAEG